MDPNLISIHVIGIIILVLSNINETESTEYYCTSEGNWKTTMTTCLKHGGRPASYLDLTNGTEIKVKRGTTVWTADYLFLAIVQDVPRITPDYDCGYTRLRESYNQSSRTYTYTPTDVNYDICSKRKHFICENSSDIFEGWKTANWSAAYSLCRLTSKYKLWNGHKSIITRYQFDRYTEFWVNSARRLVRATLSSQIPINRHATDCGTSEGVIKHGRKNICVQDLQAICISEHKITDTRFSRSCLEETVTEIFNSKKTSSMTKLSTQSTLTSTTIEPSTQLTMTTTMTELSTRSTLTSTVTEPSTRSTLTSTMTEPSTQSTLTSTMTEPSTQLTLITTVTEPSTQATLTFTELLNSKTSTVFSKKSTDPFTKIFNDGETATIIGPSTQPTVISTRFMNKFGFQSTPDGLSKTTITGIITATVAFSLSCIVAGSFLLYFCRKRQNRNEANTKVVQFKHDSPPTASVVLNRVSDHDEAEVEANYEIAPDNIQPVYINERADVHLEALATADYENAYVNNMPEAYYEVVPDNIHVNANEREDDRYEALVRVKESVYVNETPEGCYEGLVPDNTESV